MGFSVGPINLLSSTRENYTEHLLQSLHSANSQVEERFYLDKIKIK